MKAKLLVFTNARPGQESAFNTWYDAHLEEILELPGFMTAQRFEAADPAQAGGHRYLAVYDVEAENPRAVVQELQSAVQAGKVKVTDAMDASSLRMALYEPMAEEVKAKQHA